MAAHRHINNRTMRACVRAYVCARYEFTGKQLGAGSFGTVVEAFDRGEAGLLTQAAAAAAARTDAANGGRGTRVAVKNCQVARLEKLDDYAYSEVLRQLSPLSLSLPIHARAHTHAHTCANWDPGISALKASPSLVPRFGSLATHQLSNNRPLNEPTTTTK